MEEAIYLKTKIEVSKSDITEKYHMPFPAEILLLVEITSQKDIKGLLDRTNSRRSKKMRS